MANWIHEKVQNGEFITWEVNQAYTREAITVDATLADVEPGTVVEHAPGKFAIVINRVRKGRVAKTACIVRGAAIVILDLLIFPAVADGADVGTSPAEETAAKRAEALAYFDTKAVIARN